LTFFFPPDFYFYSITLRIRCQVLLYYITYYWIDTGLEYTATKEHLNFLEKEYGIEIQRIKPKKSIPTCVKQYGVPFLSKYVSEQMMRLQAHGFQWEDEPLEVLLKNIQNVKRLCNGGVIVTMQTEKFRK
jgi:hypothetical protein